MTLFNQMSDEELVKLYADGNNEAFGHLLLRHKDYIFSHIYSYVKNEDDSNDIFQETFIKVITCIRNRSYSEEGKFRYWVMRIAHNMVMDYMRANASKNVVSAENEDFTLLNNKDISDGSIEDFIISTQTENQLLGLIKYLPENQRQIVYMRFYEDKSFKEISEQLGCSINTSLGRMRYAILNMRKLAKEKNYIG